MKTNEVNKEISYETLLVTFGEGIGRLDTMFDDPQVWGVATLKQWIDGYETTRFTEIDDRTAVITSEYNMDSVKEWLQKNTPIINLEKTIKSCASTNYSSATGCWESFPVYGKPKISPLKAA